MTQVSKVLSIAKAEVGYRAERAPGERPSGHQKYSPQVPGLEWSNYQPWCATWVSWVAMKAGVASLLPRTASVWTAMNWFKNKGRWSDYPAIGAQVIYGTTGSTHTGICYAYDETFIYTYEGNTSLTNDANGNGVMARKRRRRDAYVHGYGLPAYVEGVVTADPALRGKAGFTYRAAASSGASGGGTPSKGKYTIKRGQTLGGIAALLGVSLGALLAINPQIKNPDRVDEGQEINVPSKPKPPAPKPKPPAPKPPAPKPKPPAPKPPQPPAAGTYTVAKGDSLSSIANRFGVSVTQLVAWNPGVAANPHLIYPGQKVRVRAGKHAAVPEAVQKPSKEPMREQPRPSKPVAPAVPQPSQDDRLARIEKELHEVKGKLDEVSGKLDKLTPKPPEKPDQGVKPQPAKPERPVPAEPEVSRPTDVPVVPQLVIPAPATK
ncbi:LysM peptidoglycan-binding domain-containing protein [Streptomyces spectabilis]|uniref:LysM peptidoglycan-binding domain-containing protein n=1 Tax=Streptomyces spectabilis TaxID=68270 RepID=UPI0033C5CE68